MRNKPICRYFFLLKSSLKLFYNKPLCVSVRNVRETHTHTRTVKHQGEVYKAECVISAAVRNH